MKVYLVGSGAGPATHVGGTASLSEAVKALTKVYMAGTDGGNGDDLKAIGRTGMPLRILLSYHYYKDENLDELLDSCFEGIELDVFADSGAWSAWSVGAQVEESAYVEWAERWQHRFTAIAGPDVIGDPAKSAAATDRMIARGLKVPVLPVFHVGEDWSWLTRWREVPYIAFGGMVPYTRQKKLLDAWLSKAFSMLPEGQKVHGFGLTTWSLLTKYPWYSVDSSSWTAGFRYAQLSLFDDKRGRFVQISMADRSDLLKNAKLMESYGIRPGQVLASDYDRDILVGVSVDAWRRAEEWLSHRNSSRVYLSCGTAPIVGAPNRPEQLGPTLKCYMSLGSAPIEGSLGRPEQVGPAMKKRMP